MIPVFINIVLDEEWRDINSYDIEKNRYRVSNMGNILDIKNNKIRKYNNPKNEKGYCRIALSNTSSSSYKKYPVHRLVMLAFNYIEQHEEYEVNHKDGDKLNNCLLNLEWVTPDYNKLHAKLNGFYKCGEDLHLSKLSNNEVHWICKRLEEGLNAREIYNQCKFRDKVSSFDSCISKILNQQSFTSVSNNYNFDTKTIRYKKYSFDDIVLICEMICDSKSNAEICDKLSHTYTDRKKLNNTIKKIRQGKLYKHIYYKVISQ